MVESLSILVGLGIIVGFVASFIGIGGGAFIVPILIFVFNEAPMNAIIGVSLATIFFNSVLISFSFYKKLGVKSFFDSKRFIIGTIPGSILGAVLLTYIPEKNVKLLFSFFLLVQAFKLITKAFKDQEIPTPVKELSYELIGFLGGMISSLTGLGGGAVFVPLIKSATNIKTKDITMVSNHVMVLATFIGLIPILFSKDLTNLPFKTYELGMVNFMMVAVIVLGGFVSRPIGLRLNDKMNEKNKSLLLALVFVVLSVKILLSIY